MDIQTISKSIVLAAGLTLAPISLLQAAQPGPYFGIGAGSADDQLLHENSSAFKLFGGVNLTRGLGLEASYVDLGTYRSGAISQDGVAFEIIGYLPLNSEVDLFGRGGFFNWEVADDFGSVTGTDPTFGVGINIRLNHSAALRGEWQTFLDVDGGDVDMYSASLSFHF